ncbi:MAG TPA: nitroreductase family protein, partial [Methanomassiliicoccales archaeon]|nr:nitroreductase family protein [Methanomassiliicoccales archaeon]
MNQVMAAINSRRSVRSYTKEPLSREQVMHLLESGTRAPNGCNMQPWRFVVITDQDVLERYNAIAKRLFGKHLEKQIMSDPPGVENLRHLKAMMDDPATDIFQGAPC